jgi:hypothetical protein
MVNCMIWTTTYNMKVNGKTTNTMAKVHFMGSMMAIVSNMWGSLRRGRRRDSGRCFSRTGTGIRANSGEIHRGGRGG